MSSSFFTYPFPNFVGTTKRKELHGTINVHPLLGTWIHEGETVTLNVYRLDFHCEQEGENYAGFILLMESLLDNDVARSEMDLFLIPNKRVYTTVTPCGKIQLNEEQVVQKVILLAFLLLEFCKLTHHCLTFLVFFSCVEGSHFKNSSSMAYLVDYFMVPEQVDCKGNLFSKRDMK
jgi:hypothetical protein